MAQHPPPPFDPELDVVLKGLADKVPPTITPEMIGRFRALPADPTVGGLVDRIGALHEERTIAGHAGADIAVSIFRAGRNRAPGPGILYLHGGGMIFGNRFGGVAGVPSVHRQSRRGRRRRRLSPRTGASRSRTRRRTASPPSRGWIANAVELGIDPRRLIVAGQSAGAGLAAGVCLLARERGAPAISAQVLVSPMLDDRDDTVSAHQIDGIGVWDHESNLTGWTALLGERRGGDDVPATAAPARADDLAGLPAAFISVGSAEVFRDEAVAFASRMWAAADPPSCMSGPVGSTDSRTSHPAPRITAAATRRARRLADTDPRGLTDLVESAPMRARLAEASGGEQTVRVCRDDRPETRDPNRREP